MDTLARTRALMRAGRFEKALKEYGSHAAAHSTASDLVQAELLERTGSHDRARTLLKQLSARRLSHYEQSICFQILFRVEREAGNGHAARVALQKAITAATAAKDITQTCLSKLPLVLLLADEGSPEAALGLVAELRNLATRLGDPLIFAELHLTVGELDARRGLFNTAERHTQIAHRILESEPNLRLQASAENNLLALAILNSDFAKARDHAKASLARTDDATMLRATCLGNLGNIEYLAGRFDSALDYLQSALAACVSGETRFGIFESIARIFLAQGKIQECEHLINTIDAAASSDSKTRYVQRYTQITKAALLAKQNRDGECLACLEDAVGVSIRAKDRLLGFLARIGKSRVLARLKRTDDALDEVRALLEDIPSLPPDSFAQYEAALADLLRSEGRPGQARTHALRAGRVFSTLGRVTDFNQFVEGFELNQQDSQLKLSPAEQSSNLLQNVAALMLHAGRPELLATSAVAILADTGAVHRVEAIARSKDGTVEILAAFGESPASPEPPMTIAIGTARDRSIELCVHTRPDIESTATMNSMLLLFGTIRSLERAQAEREEQLALWPIDEVAMDGDKAVVGGCLRELLTFARKVAPTNVSVLITGESGTGKEILARAIHGYSTRADKPFIPFNCTAVPREMLESQLFGYRRGAFTGADRDNPGLIRAAKGGTLFLDEIGELSVDLQPKLLRFLESGEISPLGENPSIADVRIVAATNRNLDQLVQDGGFREDLYYRLNVIRLTIPPLRERRDEIPALVHHFVMRAASEFGKGQVRVAEETMEHLLLYPWPGNIRQLYNEIRRLVALADTDAVLKPSILPADIRRVAASSKINNGEIAVSLGDKLMPTIWRIETEMIRAALRSHKGRVEDAARALGISRKGLYLKRQRLGL